MMRRVVNWGLVAGVVSAGPLLMGAEPAVPRSMPPLPVPPIEHQKMPPYLARVTISGDAKMTGVFEECMDLARARKSAQAQAGAHRVEGPPPLTGCTNASEVRPGGLIHHEMACDQAKGAKASFRVVSDGTPNELRIHTERYDAGSATAARRTIVYDSHMVRLGPCPADLKPGQMRRPGGPVIEEGEAARLRTAARGTPP